MLADPEASKTDAVSERGESYACNSVICQIIGFHTHACKVLHSHRDKYGPQGKAMSVQPSVCCIMLVNGRPEMTRLAIQSFRAQAYQNKRLLLWDSTPGLICCDQTEDDGVFHVPAEPLPTIGQLRNAANGFWNTYDLFAHFDSDDWSHPRRLEEQVALLEASGKECVGYSDMLFWDTTPGKFCGAWLWSDLDKRHPIGTSLMYRRSAWERVPFLALPNKAGATGEEYNWLKQVDALGVSSVKHLTQLQVDRQINRTTGSGVFAGLSEVSVGADRITATQGEGMEPRMIASIHGANTQYYDPADYVANQRGTSWRRAAEFDDYCRKVMTL